MEGDRDAPCANRQHGPNFAPPIIFKFNFADFFLITVDRIIRQDDSVRNARCKREEKLSTKLPRFDERTESIFIKVSLQKKYSSRNT